MKIQNRRRGCWGRGASKSLCCLAALAFLLAAPGCKRETAGEDKPSEAASPPDHPAMSAGTSTPRAGAPEPSGTTAALPAGHPPIEGDRPAPAAGTAAASAPAGKLEVAGLLYTPPEGWVAERPSNPMRLAQFRLPHAEGDARDAELTVSSAGGSVEDNIKRWRDEFEGSPPAAVEEKKVSGIDVVTVSIEGTFLYKERPFAPGPGTPRPGYKVLAAIVQAPEAQVFFKAWGPKATMEKWQASFGELIASLQPR
jgi:hypothetical protein